MTNVQFNIVNSLSQPSVGSKITLSQYFGPITYSGSVTYNGPVSGYTDNNGNLLFSSVIPTLYEVKISQAGANNPPVFNNYKDEIYYISVPEAYGNTVSASNCIINQLTPPSFVPNTASYAITASYSINSGEGFSVSSSWASSSLSASFSPNQLPDITDNNGSVTVNGNLTASNISIFSSSISPTSFGGLTATCLTAPSYTIAGQTPSFTIIDGTVNKPIVSFGNDFTNAGGYPYYAGEIGIIGNPFPNLGATEGRIVGGLSFVNAGITTTDNRAFVLRVKSPGPSASGSDNGGYTLFENRYAPYAPDADTLFANWLGCNQFGNVLIGDGGQIADSIGIYQNAKVTVFGSPNSNYSTFQVIPAGYNSATPTFLIDKIGNITQTQMMLIGNNSASRGVFDINSYNPQPPNLNVVAGSLAHITGSGNFNDKHPNTQSFAIYSYLNVNGIPNYCTTPFTLTYTPNGVNESYYLSMSWTPVAGASGYMIVINDPTLGYYGNYYLTSSIPSFIYGKGLENIAQTPVVESPIYTGSASPANLYVDTPTGNLITTNGITTGAPVYINATARALDITANENPSIYVHASGNNSGDSYLRYVTVPGGNYWQFYDYNQSTNSNLLIGNVSASLYYGNGANITGVVSSSWASASISSSIAATASFVLTASIANNINPLSVITASGLFISSSGNSTPLLIVDNINNFAQLNLYNYSSTSASSTDIVASNSSGSDNAYYIDMGINSPTYNQGFVGNANDAYLYTTGSNLYIGNVTPGKKLYLFAGGYANTSSVAIDGNGGITASQFVGTASLALTASSLQYTLINNSSNGPLTVGCQAGNANNIQNVVIGYQAGYYSATGSYATMVGYQVGENSINNATSVQIGNAAGYNSATASSAIQIGFQCGFNSINAKNAVQIGYQAGAATGQAAGTVQIGYQVGNNCLTASNAIQIGYAAGQNTTNGTQVCQIGFGAGANSQLCSNATQIGFQVGVNSTTASNATQIGYQAGYNAYNAPQSTMIGYAAGYNAATSSNATFVGYAADASNPTASVNNSIAIGYQAKVSTANTCVIGGTGVNAVNVSIGNTTAVNTLDVMGNISCSVITASVYLPVMIQLPYSASGKALTPLVQTGSMYINATSKLMFVYTGTTWNSCSLY